jgi:hypothetical protein
MASNAYATQDVQYFDIDEIDVLDQRSISPGAATGDERGHHR